MIIYILTKRYADNSGFLVMGATTDRAIAQAFHAGGTDSDPHSEVYQVDDNNPVRSMGREYDVLTFEDVDLSDAPDVPSPATSTISDDDIPF